MSNTKKPVMGCDPLAWLKEEGDNAPESMAEQQAPIAEASVPHQAAETIPSQVEEESAMATEEETEEESVEVKQAEQVQSQENVFRLESRATIAQVEELFKALHEAVGDNCQIKVDAGNVDTVDTAILQLFVVFLRETQESSCEFEWLGVSDAFRDAARLLNLETHLNFPV